MRRHCHRAQCCLCTLRAARGRALRCPPPRPIFVTSSLIRAFSRSPAPAQATRAQCVVSCNFVKTLKHEKTWLLYGVIICEKSSWNLQFNRKWRKVRRWNFKWQHFSSRYLASDLLSSIVNCSVFKSELFVNRPTRCNARCSMYKCINFEKGIQNSSNSFKICEESSLKGVISFLWI